MPKVVDGIKYAYVSDIAEKFDYSEYHLRNLARKYAAGDKVKGIKGTKTRNGKWALDVEDARKKLNIDALERLESDETGQQSQSKPVGKSVELDDDWI